MERFEELTGSDVLFSELECAPMVVSARDSAQIIEQEIYNGWEEVLDSLYQKKKMLSSTWEDACHVARRDKEQEPRDLGIDCEFTIRVCDSQGSPFENETNQYLAAVDFKDTNLGENNEKFSASIYLNFTYGGEREPPDGHRLVGFIHTVTNSFLKNLNANYKVTFKGIRETPKVGHFVFKIPLRLFPVSCSPIAHTSFSFPPLLWRLYSYLFRNPSLSSCLYCRLRVS